MLNSWQKKLKKFDHHRMRKFLSYRYIRSKKFRRKIYGLFYLSIIIVLFFWNWTLFLATSTGIGMMVFAYILQGWNWENYYYDFQKWFQGTNRRLTVAVGMGGISAFIIYLITNIWLTSHNRWMATGAILQGLVTLLIGGVLLWQTTTSQKLKNQEKFEDLLEHLTQNNQLKRLLAIRKLTNLFLQNHLTKSQQKQLNDYFQIMLSNEEEIILQEALLESLEELNFSNKNPLQIPLNLEKSQQLNTKRNKLKVKSIIN